MGRLEKLTIIGAGIAWLGLLIADSNVLLLGVLMLLPFLYKFSQKEGKKK